MNKSHSISIEQLSSALTYIELVLIGILLISICVVTIICNALVLISFVVDKNLRTLSNYFLLSLAVSDIMIATFSMPLFTMYLLVGEWTLGPIMCDMWLAQDYTCGNASFLNLLMIAIDRYLSVTDPLRYRAKRTGKRVGLMISCVWITAFLVWPPWIYAWPYIEGKRTVPEDDCYIQFLETNTYVTIVTAVIDYYVPVSIILVLYYKIWRETRKRRRYLADMRTGHHHQAESVCSQSPSFSNANNKRGVPPSETFINDQNTTADDEAEKDNTVAALLDETPYNDFETVSETGTDAENRLVNNTQIPVDSSTGSNQDSTLSDQHKMYTTQKIKIKQDDKAARVLTAILLAFIVTTTPYNILVIVKSLDTTHSLVPHSVWNFFYYLFYVNSTFNPLCYALANENFRNTYRQILTCSWSKKRRGMHSMSNYSNKSTESKSSHNAKQVTSSV